MDHVALGLLHHGQKASPTYAAQSARKVNGDGIPPTSVDGPRLRRSSFVFLSFLVFYCLFFRLFCLFGLFGLLVGFSRLVSAFFDTRLTFVPDDLAYLVLIKPSVFTQSGKDPCEARSRGLSSFLMILVGQILILLDSDHTLPFPFFTLLGKVTNISSSPQPATRLD